MPTPNILRCFFLAVLVHCVLLSTGHAQQAPAHLPAAPQQVLPNVVPPEQPATQPASPPADPTPAQELEQKALALLAGGRQAEAEAILENYLAQLTNVKRIVKYIYKGQQIEAANAIAQRAALYRENQRALFLFAACFRSRFTMMTSVFKMIDMIDSETPVGRCASYMVQLDAPSKDARSAQQVFAEFEKDVSDNPDDVALRWMLAVECRTYNRNATGAAHYQKIVAKWNPGPVLVHQTYANLLDGLNRHRDALVERQTAVALEPAGWSYDGLGNTLDSLGRYDEAADAHARAQERDPENGHHLGNWAANSLARKKTSMAIRQCERAVELDPTYLRTWTVWRQALQAQGNKPKAVAKYREALKTAPKSVQNVMWVEGLRQSLGLGS